MNEIQTVEYNIFIEFDRVCKKLNLKYFADSGTLLGACRHNGFIPWDDDMDFVMLRKDYDFFCKHAQRLLPKHLFVQTYFTDKYYPYPFLKIRDSRTTYISDKKTKFNQGIWIDIFPLDFISSNKKLIKKHEKKKWELVRRLLIGTFPKQINIKHLFGNFISFVKHPVRSKTVKKLDFLLKNAPDSTFENVSYMWGGHDESKLFFSISHFEKQEFRKFENTLIATPKNPEIILEKCYGDWKTPPPPSQRVGHFGKIIDTKKSYLEYLK